MAARTSLIALAAAALVSGGRAAAVPLPGVNGEPAAPPREEAQAPAATPPQAIPVEHVFRAADELDAPLRKASAAAEPEPAVREVEARLGSSVQMVERLRALVPQRVQDASAREIERLRQEVGREDLRLTEDQAVLEKRSDLLAGTTREIQDRLESWRLTADAARKESAPPAVLRRIQQAEDGLRAAEVHLRTERDALLGLQARVSELRGELSRLATSLAEADAVLQRQLFEVESAPLWRAMVQPQRSAALGGQVRQALREGGRDVAAFVAEEKHRIWADLAIVLVLGVALVALRRPVAAMEAQGASLRGAVRMLARPWSAAILLSVPVARALHPPLLPTVRDVLYLAFLAPLLRILPGLVPAAFRRPLYGAAALFALDKLASLAPPRTLLARLSVLLVTVAALAGVVRGLRRGGWARQVRGRAWGAAARGAALAAAALLAVSAVSNVVGNTSLAEQLTRATLASAILLAVLVGVAAVLEGALAALLHLPSLQRRLLVARHRALLQRRIATVLRLACVVFWVSRTAAELGAEAAIGAAAGAVLGLRLTVGGLDVSLGNVVAFAVTLAIAVAVSRAVRFVLDEGVFTEIALPRGVPAALSATAQYVLLILGFSWAVLASGMEMSRFSFLLGALGVGIGFGLQNVVNNFVSGLILLYERPVQVRDIVEVGSVAGEVTRIGVRSSTVRTFSGAEVIVPNATLISTEVTNWTLSDRLRRIDLPVGVAYGTPPQQVIELLLATVRGRRGVLQVPEPVALLLRFGESAMEFVLRFWTADFERWQALASETLTEIQASLGRAGIEIPFPQRDLHVRSVDAAAAVALAGDGERRDGSDREHGPQPPNVVARR